MSGAQWGGRPWWELDATDLTPSHKQQLYIGNGVQSKWKRLLIWEVTGVGGVKVVAKARGIAVVNPGCRPRSTMSATSQATGPAPHDHDRLREESRAFTEKL